MTSEPEEEGRRVVSQSDIAASLWKSTVVQRSGDGWYEASDGRVFWGKYGAAGLFVRCVVDGPSDRFLVVRRAAWVHLGCGEWAIPGGARDDGEAAFDAAVREFTEEMGRPPSVVRRVAEHVDEVAPGEWSYVTFLVDVPDMPSFVDSMSDEHVHARWVTTQGLDELPLFAPFRAALPQLLMLFQG